MSIRPRLNGYRCALAVALSYACVAILPGFSVPSSFGQEQVQGEIRAYALRHRNADDLAPQLRNMLSGLAGNANVSVDRENNRLLVQGLAQSQQLALQVIQALDKPVDPPKSPAPLPNAANSSVVKSYRVSGDLDRIANQLRTRYPNGSGVRIATDPRTQQLLVIAPPALQQRIAQELSGQAPQPAATAPVRQPALPARPVVPNAAAPVRATSYQLMHTSWREFEGGLQQLLGARIRTSTARNGELLMVHLVTVNGLQPVLQIDRAANKITFERTAQTEAWRQLTHAVDTAKAAAPGELQLVPIRNADPNKVQTVVSLIRAAQNTKDGNVTAAVQAGAGRRGNDWNGQMLTKVFQQENGQPLQPNPATAPPAAAQPGAPAAAQPGAPVGVGDELGVDDDGTGGLLGPVQIEFLEGLDIIIIRGRKRDVERVQRIIAEIEEKSKETQPIVEVHHLKHIDNEAAVTLVTELYDEILSARQGQVSIRALVEPNAILLIGRKESVEEVIKLIEKLDQPDTGDFTIIRLKNISALDAEVTVRGFFVTRPGQDDNPRLGLGTQVKIIADYLAKSAVWSRASMRTVARPRRRWRLRSFV